MLCSMTMLSLTQRYCGHHCTVLCLGVVNPVGRDGRPPTHSSMGWSENREMKSGGRRREVKEGGREERERRGRGKEALREVVRGWTRKNHMHFHFTCTCNFFPT